MNTKILKSRRLGSQSQLLRVSDEALAANEASEALSGDGPVAPFMSVSTESTGADQTRDGAPGLLLGIGESPRSRVRASRLP